MYPMLSVFWYDTMNEKNQLKYCKCGCGGVIKGKYKRYLDGHVEIWENNQQKIKRYCICGCGEIIKIKAHHRHRGIPKLVHGHRIKGMKHTEESIRKMRLVQSSPEFRKRKSELMKGRKHSIETIQKMSKSKMGHEVSEETRKKISEATKKATSRPDVKAKMSHIIDDWVKSKSKLKILCECGCGGYIIIRSSHKYSGIPRYLVGHYPKGSQRYNYKPENHTIQKCECGCGKDSSPGHRFITGHNCAIPKGFKHSKITRENMSAAQKKSFKNHPERTQNLRDLWKNPEYLKKIRKAMEIKPTSFERKINRICKSNNLPFKYVGDYSFWINGGNPDFIHKYKKLIIEVYTVYYKNIEYGNEDNYKTKRQKQFAGWKVLFLNDKYVVGHGWEKRSTEKIIEFEKS